MTYVYDIESYPNFFVVVVHDVAEDRAFHFEIGPDRNDLGPLAAFFYNRPFWLVGFNSKHYDDAVMAWIWKELNAYREMGPVEVARDIYGLSDRLVNDRVKHWEVKKWAHGVKWTTIDLQRYWTQLSIKSKHISLKACENLIRARDLRDLPYLPGTVLDKGQRRDLVSYGYNDVKETVRLYRAMKAEVKLRVDVGKLFFPEQPWLRKKIMSMDSVNMGMEIMMYEYMQKTGLDREDIRQRTRQEFGPVRFEQLISDRLSFDDPKMREVRWVFGQQVQHPAEKKFSYKFSYNGKTYAVGLGGIHTVDGKAVFRKGGKRYFSIDAESYYPHLLYRLGIFPPQLGREWLDLYWEKFLLRKKHKKLAKATKDPVSVTLNAALKLLINGTSGNLKSPSSPIYWPVGNVAMTLNGQLFLLKLVEMMKARGIYTESVNTDGILVEINGGQYGTMLEVVKEWEKLLDIPLEVKEYSLIVRHSVNRYFAVDGHGGVEAKGEYITEPDLMLFHARENMVVRKAFMRYFLDGTAPEDYIAAETDPLEFTFCPKSAKSFRIVYKGRDQQRVNRFAVGRKSAGAAYIYRVKGDSWGSFAGFKDVPVVMMNRVPEGTVPADHGIDTDWYIRECYKWVREVEPLQQRLFT